MLHLKSHCPSEFLWVGVGCQRGTPKSLIEQALRAVFQYDLNDIAIAGVATIDTKRQEVGLIDFCRDRNLPLIFFSIEQLRSVVVPNPSNMIDGFVGTPSVAEAAALLACWGVEGRRAIAIAETQRQQETAPSLPIPTPPILHIPKQRYWVTGQAGSVTIAVARSLETATKAAHT